MADSHCPLCGLEANIRPHEHFDRMKVDCERCGRYDIDAIMNHVGFEDFTDDEGNNYGDVNYILSGLTRQASDAGNVITITNDNISTLLQAAATPRNVIEYMHRTLLYVGEHQSQPSDDLHIFFDMHYPLVFAKNGEDFRYFLDNLVDRGLLSRRGESRNRDNQFYQITVDGWEKIERLNEVNINSNQAFVAMWFSVEMKQVYEDGIKPALNATGFDPVRVDRVEHNGKIDDIIVAEIRRSGLMVADFTGQRGGVYFEAGFALGLGIPVIWTCRKADIEDLHLDTRQFNHIDWTTPEELKERLTFRIEATMPGRAIHR